MRFLSPREELACLVHLLTRKTTLPLFSEADAQNGGSMTVIILNRLVLNLRQKGHESSEESSISKVSLSMFASNFIIGNLGESLKDTESCFWQDASSVEGCSSAEVMDRA